MFSRLRVMLLWTPALLLAGLGFWWAGHNREPASRPGQVDISWYVLITPLREVYEAQVAEFERLHPGVKVHIFWVPGSEFNVKLKTLAAAHQPEPTGDWTWADLVHAGRALTHAGADGATPVWGAARVEGWWGEWLIYVRQAGGKVFTPDGHRCLLDSPAAVAGLKFYLEKSTRHRISAPAGFEPINGFVNQRVAMVVGGHTNYWLNYNQVPGLDWDIQLLPAGPAGRSGGELAIAGYSISRDCRHPEETWALVKYLTRREAIAEVVRHGHLAVRRSVAAAVMNAPGTHAHPQNLAAAYRQFEFSEPIPHHPNYIEIMFQVVQPEVDRMLLGELTPEETGRRAATAVNEFLATFDPPAP